MAIQLGSISDQPLFAPAAVACRDSPQQLSGFDEYNRTHQRLLFSKTVLSDTLACFVFFCR